MNPPHEALTKEAMDNPSSIDAARAAAWPPSYETNPIVMSAVERGLPRPVPIAIYMDGVRYSAPLAGRSDSVVGMWMVNCFTNKRHLILTVRTNDMCRCGCRGFCSVYPLWEAIAWSCRALIQGRMPIERDDG